MKDYKDLKKVRFLRFVSLGPNLDNSNLDGRTKIINFVEVSTHRNRRVKEVRRTKIQRSEALYEDTITFTLWESLGILSFLLEPILCNIRNSKS